MNVNELVDTLTKVQQNGHGEDSVVISLAETSIGVSAHSAVANIQSGFDWDMNKMWIIPERDLMTKSDKPIPPNTKLWVVFWEMVPDYLACRTFNTKEEAEEFRGKPYIGMAAQTAQIRECSVR